MPFSFAAGDEVGQTGFKFERGSTDFFVVTLVLTNEPEVVREGLDRLRHELRLSDTTEFKFHGTPHASRLAFLTRARNWPLATRSLYVDKRLLPLDFRKLASWEIYGFFMAQLLDRLPIGELGDTTLILDEFGPSQLTIRELREQLRRVRLWGHQTRLLKLIAFRRSQSEPLIQVADMVGGVIYRWLAEGNETYYCLIWSKAPLWEYRPAIINPPT